MQQKQNEHFCKERHMNQHHYTSECFLGQWFCSAKVLHHLHKLKGPPSRRRLALKCRHCAISYATQVLCASNFELCKAQSCWFALKQVGSNTPFASHANLAHHVRYSLSLTRQPCSSCQIQSLPHTPTLLIMSDTQSAKHKTAAHMVEFLKAFKHQYLTNLSITLFIYYSIAKEKGKWCFY